MEKQYIEENSPSQVIPQFQVEGVQILRKITPEYSELFCDAKAPALPEKNDENRNELDLEFLNLIILDKKYGF